MVHYPGAPQGRQPNEIGPHGCTLGTVDEVGRVRLMPITCDVLRWHAPRVALSESADRRDLEILLRQQTGQLLEESLGTPSLVTWNIACQGPLLAALRRGQLSIELTALLRSEFGHRTPPAWTIDIIPELPEVLPERWCNEESLRGDFLRASQALLDGQLATSAASSSEAPILISPDDLPPAVTEKIGWGTLSLDEAQVRRRVLRDAAWLGADLLGPSEVSAEAER